MFADKVTVGYGTIQGVYDSDKKTLQFTIETTQGGAPFGWFATGTGNQMAGSSMAVSNLNRGEGGRQAGLDFLVLFEGGWITRPTRRAAIGHHQLEITEMGKRLHSLRY